MALSPVIASQSPPGDTLEHLLEERGIAKETLAGALRLDLDKLAALLAGELEIDGRLAEDLGRVVGPHASFWLRREAQYRKALEQVRAERSR